MKDSSGKLLWIEPKKLTQNKTILNHLQSFGSITSYEAFLKYRITRLASRIFEIKKSHEIKKEMVSKGGKTYARYMLTDFYKEDLKKFTKTIIQKVLEL